MQELQLLISQFNNNSSITIHIGDEKITLSLLSEKRDEIDLAITRLKLSKQILSNIYDSYTHFLETQRDNINPPKPESCS